MARQNLFIIVSELIRQKRRGQIVVSLALNILDSDKLLSARVIERVLNEEGSIDPQIPALAILHPRQHVGKKIQQLSEMRRDLAGGHLRSMMDAPGYRDKSHRRMLSIIVGSGGAE